jgi:hypothetical protein
MTTYVHDPEAVLDYPIDWTAWLAEVDDTIVSHEVTVEPEGAVVIDSTEATATKVTAWISGGTDGENAKVTCHIVTAGGREDDRSIRLSVRER